MQKKKARKGFLFLRRESVLPPCRAGPVCPAGTNAVFCGGTHGSRPTDRCGKPSVGAASSTSRQRGSAALQGPLCEGAVGAADWGRENRVTSLPPPALRAATSLAEGGFGRPPLRTLSLRASPQTGAAIRFPTKERADSHASDTVTGSE